MEIFGNDYDTFDGTCVRDYIHVLDLVDIHNKCLKYISNNNSIILNCGYGKGKSVLEVIEAVKKVSGIDFKVKYSSRRKGDPSSVVANNSKLINLLEWQPKFNDLDQIVSSALEWEKKFLNICN